MHYITFITFCITAEQAGNENFARKRCFGREVVSTALYFLSVGKGKQVLRFSVFSLFQENTTASDHSLLNKVAVKTEIKAANH